MSWRTRWQAEMKAYRERWDCDPVWHLAEAQWRRLLKVGASALELREAYGRMLYELMNSNRYWPDDLPGERHRLLQMIDPALVLPSGLPMSTA